MRIGRVLTGVIAPLATRHVLHRWRVAMVTVLALSCAVASLMATQLLYAAVVGSYERTTRAFAGRAALAVGNGESGVPEELADEIRRLAGVRAVAASVEGFVTLPDVPGERLYLYGVDLLADQDVRDYGAGATAVVNDPMVFLAAPDSVALTAEFASTRGLVMHDRVRVLTPAGEAVLTVRAMLGRQAGPATALDGRLAVVDLSVAQQLLRLDERVSQLAVDVDPGARLSEVEQRIAAVVGARGVVERPRTRAATFARLLTNYRDGILLAAAVGLLVALHFVANLATVAIAERRRELALLRTLGASSRVVAALVIGEIAIVALAATLLGVPLSLAAARALLARFGEGAAVLYGDAGPASIRLEPSILALTASLGICGPIFAAIAPVRHVLRIRPVEALRVCAESRNRRVGFAMPAFGAGCIGLAGALWRGRGHLGLSAESAGMATTFASLVGVTVLLPAIVRGAAAVLDRCARERRDVAVVLAARWVAAERHRIAVTCAALTVGLAGAIGVSAWTSSLEATLHAAFDAVFGRVDLVVSGGADPFARQAVRLPAALADEISRWPQVAFADGFRVDTVAFGGSRATVVARDARAYVDGRRRLLMVEGDAVDAARRLAAGTAVVVNRAFATRFGLGRGDVVELATPGGALRLPIAGIHLELTPGDLGVVQLDRGVYRRWWRDDSLSLVEVGLRHVADRRSVGDAIRARWGSRHGVVVLTVDALRETYRAMLGRLAALVRPLLVVSLVCALTGLVGASTAAVLVRRPTHAVLRAIGCTRGQLKRATTIELTMLAGLAVLAATAIGSVLGRMQVEVLLRGMLGLAVEYAFPHRLAAVAAIGVVVPTALVGWLLGRHAARVPIGTTLQAE